MTIDKLSTVLKNILLHLYWPQMWLVQFMLILLCFMQLSDEEITKLYYNIDYLYLPSLFIDLFIDGNSIRTWSLTPNPYFFPDMPIYFLIYSIVQHPGYTIIIFSFFQLIIIEWIWFKILQLFLNDKVKSRSYFIWSFFILNLFLIAGGIGKEAFMGHLLLTASSHLGAVVSGLLSFYFFIKYWKSLQWKWLVPLFFTISISFISDRLFLVQTLGSLFLGAVIFSFKKRNVSLIITICLSTFLGWLIFNYLNKNLRMVPDASKPPMGSKASLDNFLAAFTFISNHYVVGRAIVYFHIVLMILSPFGLFFLKKEIKIWYLLLILSAIMAFCFPIYYGFFQAIDTFRYILLSYIYLFLLSPIILLGGFKFPEFKKISLAFSCILMGFVFVVALRELSYRKLKYFIDYKEEHVRLVLNNGANLENGIADYWHAKDVYVLGSHKNRVVSAKDNDFDALPWQANRIWYTGEKGNQPPVFNFTINLRPDSILGPPMDSIKGDHSTIFIFRDFTFKRAETGRIFLHPLEQMD